MTSVKAFVVLDEPTETELGSGAFEFTDAYSVFDWGKMPDEIARKGASLCSMGAGTFEALEANDIPTHYRGVGDPRSPVSLEQAESAPTRMAIELTTVPDLPFSGGEYAYAEFYDAVGSHYLVPLEIVFRNRVPIGSSLRRRTDPAEHDLDYTEWPDRSIELVKPIIEFSTKFEETDRYLTTDEAADIAGPASLRELRETANAVNQIITEQADTAGLTHLDGKIECLYHDGSIKVADVAGTLDENRFAAEGRQLSKEVIRQYYKRADPAWVDAVADAKVAAREQGVADWRSLCERGPTSLPSEVAATVSRMYRSVANAYLGRQLFQAPPLHALATELETLSKPK